MSKVISRNKGVLKLLIEFIVLILFVASILTSVLLVEVISGKDELSLIKGNHSIKVLDDEVKEL